MAKGSDVAVNYPGAVSTQIIGANAAGVVFGNYQNTAGGETFAFAYNATSNGAYCVVPGASICSGCRVFVA
jgi:hypothetical protein